MKYFLEIQYHGFMKEADTIDEMFAYILNLYKTKKWWDYDGFRVVQSPSYKEAKENYPNLIVVDWKSKLTDSQAVELKQWKDWNFKEMQ